MNPFAFHFPQWVLAILSAITIGMSKAGFIGIGIVPVVVMAHLLPAKASTGAIIPMFITADIVAVTLFRRYTVWRYVFRLLPASLAGVVCGAWLMNRIPSSVFGHALGVLILLISALMLLQRMFGHHLLRLAEYPSITLPAGWLAGVMTMLANSAGSLMTVYLLACKLPKMEFVGTLAWFFFLINLSKLPLSASMGLINKESLLLNLILVPFVLIGVWLGRRLLSMFNQSAFEILILLLSLGGGIELTFGR